MIVVVDHTLCTDHDPFQDCAAGLIEQEIGIILDVRFPFNPGIERDHDQPPPGTGVDCADLRQMVGIEHQRVAWHVAEGVFVLLFGVDFVRIYVMRRIIIC